MHLQTPTNAQRNCIHKLLNSKGFISNCLVKCLLLRHIHTARWVFRSILCLQQSTGSDVISTCCYDVSRHSHKTIRPLSWVFNEWWSSPIGWLCSVIWKRSIVHNNNMYCPWFYSRGGKQARFKHDKFFSVSLLFLFWKTWENGNSFFFSLLLLLLFLVLLLLWSFCHLPILSWFINTDSRIHIDSQRHIFQNMSSPH